MPHVTCTACGQGADVSFKRGTRLATIPCPGCHELKLRMASAGRTSKNTGKTYERCARCGRRGLRHQHPAFDWSPQYGAPDEVFPAGSPCCWVEEPVPAARVAHQTVHKDLEVRLGPRRGAAFCWATPEERAALEQAAPPLPRRCTVCADAGLPPRKFHVQAYGFAQGIALVGVCDGCSNTFLLAELTTTS